MTRLAKWLGIVLVVIGLGLISNQFWLDHQQAQVGNEVSNELEFEHFGQPRQVQWIGQPQQVLTYGRLLLTKVDAVETTSSVFIVEPEDDGQVWGELLDRELIVTGRWIGNICGYWLARYGQCVPWIEIETVQSTRP